MVGAAWRWRQPTRDTIKRMVDLRRVNERSKCFFCGEPGTMLLCFREDNGEDVSACRECASLRHAPLMDPKDWLAVPCEASQYDMLHASRLLSSVEESLVEMLGNQSKMKMNPNFRLDLEVDHSLPWSIFKYSGKELPQAIAALERVRDRLLPVRAHMLSLARAHERSCWLLHGVHPLHPSAPREGLVYWYAGTARGGSLRISNLLQHAFPHWNGQEAIETNENPQILEEHDRILHSLASLKYDDEPVGNKDALPIAVQHEPDAAARALSKDISDFIDQLCNDDCDDDEPVGKEDALPIAVQHKPDAATRSRDEGISSLVESVLISNCSNVTFVRLVNLARRNLDYLSKRTWLPMTRDENNRFVTSVLDAMKVSLLSYLKVLSAQSDAATKENVNGEDVDMSMHAPMAYLRFELMVEDALTGISGNHLIRDASSGAGEDDALSQPDRADAGDESRS